MALENKTMKITTRICLRVIWKVLSMLFIAVLLCGIYIYYRPVLKDASKGIFAIPAFAVLYIIILIKSKFFKTLSDKTWVGEIQSVKTIIAGAPITFSVIVERRPVLKIPYTIVEVRIEDGKVVTLKIQARKMSPSVFKIGGRIKHYKTAKYPVLLDPPRPDINFCPLCGRDLNNPFCPDCKIKF